MSESAEAGPPNCPDAGMVVGEVKISDTAGGFGGMLDGFDQFGRSAANAGDIDGDGIPDLAVGALFDDDGGPDHGAVWVLFMNSDGTVRDEQKISDSAGGFSGVLNTNDYFGVSVAGLGDVDSDGIPDLAVGAFQDDDGGTNRGAVWVLLLNANGTVRAEQKISDVAGGFSGVLDNGDFFGWSVAGLGDLDGDGVPDLAVGAYSDDDGGPSRGAVWVLFINVDGTVRASQKISETEGDFDGALNDGDTFGTSTASAGDVDGDGISDLAVGSSDLNSGGRGALWVLFMNANGTVRTEQKISDSVGGFEGVLDNSDLFGIGVAGLGDLDGDGVPDLAVGAYGDDDGGESTGAAWVLLLNSNGTVRAHQKISEVAGGFGGQLDVEDGFGSSVANLGDLDGNGLSELVVGAYGDDDGALDSGAVWIVSIDGCPVVPPCCNGNADGMGGVNFADITSVLAHFGSSGTIGVQNPGDANCNGVVNFADVTEVLSAFGSMCP